MSTAKKNMHTFVRNRIGIERVHLKKYVLKVRKSTSSVGVYGEIGRYLLYITVR